MVPYSGLAEPLLQPFPALAAQVPAGEDAQTVHPFGGFRPNAMEPANLQLRDERGTGGGRDQILAIGYVLVRGEFCQKLDVGDAGRCGSRKRVVSGKRDSGGTGLGGRRFLE